MNAEITSAKVSVAGVSCPGGLAQQFRVQVASEGMASKWAMIASFRDGEKAEACAAAARVNGDVARVVCCRALPTAA